MNFPRLHAPLVCALALAALCLGGGAAVAKEWVPPALKAISVDQKIGSSVDPGLSFLDQDGKAVTLGDYLGDGKPLLLTLNYFSCKMLCSLQLNALLPAIRGAGVVPGTDYRIVTVSIDPREGPELARAKRASYVNELKLGPEVDWSFLTGTQETITALADEVGFRYTFDAGTDQFAHGAAVYFLSPAGVISRYLFGLTYLARDLRFAVLDAAEGKLGSIIDVFLLSCFHYDSELGSYETVAWRVMRLGGVAIVLALSSFLSVMWRIELKRRATEVL